jgi:regulation of enolase protein 1 (concanavalin A-like superfamily)
LQRMVSGAFALQTRCSPGARDRPVVGGLVAWKDERTYLRLDIGSMSPGTVLFGGCIGNRDIAIGRGRIGPDDVRLRLERVGSSVRALCSTDGNTWFSVGEAAFPVDDPLEVGLFADGAIRPELYPRTCFKGSCIRFAVLNLEV